MAGPQQYAINNILKTYTGMYRNAELYGSAGAYNPYLNPSKPIFAKFWIPIMLNDPHVWYGMEILKGPVVSKAKYVVECEDMEVAEYIDRQIQIFWSSQVVQPLDCLAWGYSCSEVEYEYNNFKGTVDFKSLKYLHPRDVKVCTSNGKMLGIEISNIRGSAGPKYLSGKKILWSVNDKKVNRWYGRSRLQGAFEPWWEMNQPKGYKSIRHLWFYKNAFSGGTLYYPDGTTTDPETGEEIANALIAQELVDRKETGSSLCLPSKGGDQRDWEYEEAKGNSIPEGLLDYGDVLRDEVWQGIGVPPEVAKSEDSGSFAGRRVPQQAFYSSAQEIANDRMREFEEQVLRAVLIPLTFGGDVDFKLTPISILQTLQEEEMGAVTGKLPGQEGEGGFGEEGEEPELDENGEPIEPELDEDGNPIEDSEENSGFGGEKPLSNGRIEDRKSNAFNLKEKAAKKKKQTFPPKKKGK